MEIIMTEEEEKKTILSSGLLKKRVELPKKETSPILCGGITVQFDEEEPDIQEDLYCMKKMILMDWTCGGIPKKIKDEPKFDESKSN